MPILYEGVNAEHETVRSAVGVLTFLTWVNSYGSKCMALIQKVTSNDASTLTIGSTIFLPNSDGGIVDDLLVYKMKENSIY
jgi:aminomethyltransferase